MRKFVGSIVMSAAVLAAASSASFATLYVNEPFNYPNGNLVGNTPAVGGIWSAHSGAGAVPIQVTGGEAVVAQGSGSREDANVALNHTQGAGETLYAALTLRTSAGGPLAGDVVFSHFLVGTSGFNGRLWYTTAPDGRDFSLAVGGSNSTSVASSGATAWLNGFNFGMTLRVVVSYDFDSGDSRLWVNPASMGSTNVTYDGAFSDAINSFALRQANPTDPDPTSFIDNLCVANSFGDALNCVPEPATLGLVAMGVLALVRRRR